MNIFHDEAAFMAHYREACAIAKIPQNHIRYCDGDDLLGVPEKDANGKVVNDVDGHVVWSRRPVSGYVRASLGGLVPVPYLAPYLQSTMVKGDHAALRITPEVRVEAGLEGPLRVRTLTFELTLVAPLHQVRESLDELVESTRENARVFFPLHNDVQVETLTGPTTLADGRQATSVMFRYRALHDRADLT